MNGIGRLWRVIDRNPLLTDVVLTVVLCAIALLTIRLNWDFTQPTPGWVAAVLAVATIAPLIFRRIYPIAVLLVMTVMISVYWYLEIPEGTATANAHLIAVYGAGAYGAARWRNWARGFAAAAMAFWLGYQISYGDYSDFEGNLRLVWFLTLFANVAFMIWIWWLGDVMRARREREEQLAERTRQLEEEREENARQAVIGERVRIARELHDVVAHHVSRMGVQAAAARRVMAKSPDKAEEMLVAIEASSRDAVQEMHQLLGLLRRDAAHDSRAPQPGLSHIDELIARFRDAGLTVTLEIAGRPGELPHAVDLSAYRIIQEALTNTLKHAGSANAIVSIRYGDQAVDIEVLDDGRKSPDSKNEKRRGNGIIGMRERVNLLGGTLDVGHFSGVGFSVRARLPITQRLAIEEGVSV